MRVPRRRVWDGRPLVEFLDWTGCRLGEALALQVGSDEFSRAANQAGRRSDEE